MLRKRTSHRQSTWPTKVKFAANIESGLLVGGGGGGGKSAWGTSAGLQRDDGGGAGTLRSGDVRAVEVKAVL